jgi:hypothetical protein
MTTRGTRQGLTSPSNREQAGRATPTLHHHVGVRLRPPSRRRLRVRPQVELPPRRLIRTSAPPPHPLPSAPDSRRQTALGWIPRRRRSMAPTKALAALAPAPCRTQPDPASPPHPRRAALGRSSRRRWVIPPLVAYPWGRVASLPGCEEQRVRSS